MKQIFVLIASLFIFHSAHCDLLTDCMNKITDNASFQSMLKNDVFKGTGDITRELVTQKKSKIFAAIGKGLLEEPACFDNISAIARRENGKVWLEFNDKTYAFQFSMSDLFNYVSIPAGIMVYNNRGLGAGDVIKLDDITELYWSNECSDHTIWWDNSVDNDAAVNVAGQKVFSQYRGDKNEFFLDFEEGNNRRAFPGLVLMFENFSRLEAIVAFGNLQTAIKAAEEFANALNGAACSNDGLAVYVVLLEEDRIGSGRVSYVAENKWSLIPSEIKDIKQVEVLDGPYIIQ